ncbi:MAG: ATP-dependent helicase [Myxococcota bacterium]
MASVLDDLNPEQREAAEHGEGPALVLAGPGTGKTTTLVGRYAYLVRRGVRPEAIFTTTFTRKAADQLRRRIEPEIGRPARDLPIGTFHSLARRMLKEVGHVVGVPPDFRVADKRVAFAVLRSLNLPKHLSADDLLDRFGRFKNRLVGPEEALAAARRAPAEVRDDRLEVAHVYAAFQEKLHEQALYDFGDMLMFCVEALRSDDDLRAGMSERFGWLMVDEFQDVNLAQVAMADALCETHDNLWVVGDDDQAIYGWRGSEVEYITDFEVHHPGAKVVRLRLNYRSPPAVLEAAGHLIRRNRSRLDKDLEAVVGDKRSLVAIGADDEEDEAARIADAVRKLSKRTPWREIAVLVRTRHLFVHLEAALGRLDIPFTIVGGGSFWSLPEVRTVVTVLGEATGHGGPGGGMHWLADALQSVVTIYRRKPFPKLAEQVAEAAAAKAPRSMPHERQREWADAAGEVGRQARGFEDPAAFFAHVDQAMRRERGEHVEDAVALSTIHQAKGLEWTAVFLAGCRDGLMPHDRSDDDEEERRLAYVAATRTRRYLTVTWPSTRDDKPVRPSQYVSELFGDLAPGTVTLRGAALDVPMAPPSATDRARLDALAAESAPEASRRGEETRVLHDRFGMGIVRKDRGDKWTVEFDRGGVRRVHKDWLTVVGP